MPVRLKVLLVILGVVATVLPSLPAAADAQPGGRVLFPGNRLTVRDPAQLTGRRIDLRMPNCDRQPAGCDEVKLLNQLDGFDLDPRIVVQLEGRPDFAHLRRHNFFVQRVAGGPRYRINRLVYNPRNQRLTGQPRRQLEPGTRYRVVWNGAGDPHEQVFTTMSAPRVLAQMRRQLNSGRAYADADIPKGTARRLRFNVLEGGGRAVFDVPDVTTMTRYNNRFKGQPLAEEMVIEQPAARSGARYYAFGYFNAPQWTTRNRFIPQTATGDERPRARRRQKVGFTMIVPAGAMPAGGWPVAIFGPGITRSKYDLFLAADANASRGIATVSLDPVGHAYGPRGKFGVTTLSGGEKLMPMFGRARFTSAQGEYDAITNVGAPVQPHRLASVALRDGLRQTAADVMALVRAIGRGVDVDNDGTVDLRRTGVSLYAQSLGGIYGTMVAAVDDRVNVAALNVPGGPIVEIARLSPAFRFNVAYALGHRRPSLLNGGLDCFTESAPMWGQGPVMKPAKGSAKIQAYASRANWLNRPGSPETFAPLLRRDRLSDVGKKKFLYQFAFGDETVPNPTSFLLMRAGRFADRVSYYRNDRTPTRDTNPHGFLLDPTITGREQGQAQVLDFIASGGNDPIDPDGPGNTWEVPIEARAALRRLNYNLREGVQARAQYDGKGCPEN